MFFHKVSVIKYLKKSPKDTTNTSLFINNHRLKRCFSLHLKYIYFVISSYFIFVKNDLPKKNLHKLYVTFEKQPILCFRSFLLLISRVGMWWQLPVFYQNKSGYKNVLLLQLFFNLRYSHIRIWKWQSPDIYLFNILGNKRRSELKIKKYKLS